MTEKLIQLSGNPIDTCTCSREKERVVSKKGYGIIGTGAVGIIHAQAVQALDSAELKGVYSLDRKGAEDLAEMFSCKVYDFLEMMGDDPDIEFVSICTPSGAHLEPALMMAEKGKNLIIEKPLEVTLERCDRIIEAAEKAGVLLSGIFQTRFHNSAMKLKEAVSQGRFGTISLASAYVKWFRDQDYYAQSGWRGTWKLDGGGAVMNQSIHAVDLLLWLMGPVADVKAFGATLSHKGIEVEDTLTGIMKFGNGSLGTIEATTGAWPGSFKKIEICGDRGHAVIEEDRIVTWKFLDEEQENPGDETGSAEGGVKDPIDIGYDAHMRQIGDCIQAREKGVLPSVTAEDARKAVELVLNFYDAAGVGPDQ